MSDEELIEENPCEGCEDLCWWKETCPHCKGSGIWQGCVVGGVDSPNWYGLAHPLNLTQTCQTCLGAKEVIYYCEHFRDKE